MEQLGARLKKIRLEKGISLEEVQKKTKIHPNILKAIEGDGLTDLSPVYLKSFLKIYCKFLGVPEEECFSAAKEPAKPAFFSAQQKISAKPPASLALPGIKLNKIAVFFVIGIVLVFSIAGLAEFISVRHKAALMEKEVSASLARKENKKPRATETVKPRVAAPGVSAKSAPAKKISSYDIRLGIRARENCFIVLKADGKVVFQRVLNKGRFESWQAKQKFELSVNNAAAVELEVNGQLFSKIGRKGQAVKNILITRDGMRIP